MCRRRGAGSQQTLPGFCSDLPPSWGEAGTTSCGDTAVLLYSVSCKAGRVPSSLSLAATGGLGCTPFPAACDGAFRSAGACTGRPRSRVVTSSRTFSLSASSADTASSASADERRRGRGHAVDRLHRAAMLVVPVMNPPSLISRGRCPSLFVVGRTAAVRHGELLLAITAYCPSKLNGQPAAGGRRGQRGVRLPDRRRRHSPACCASSRGAVSASPGACPPAVVARWSAAQCAARYGVRERGAAVGYAPQIRTRAPRERRAPRAEWRAAWRTSAAANQQARHPAAPRRPPARINLPGGRQGGALPGKRPRLQLHCAFSLSPPHIPLF